MHSLPLKNGLPYSQLCRVKQICGNQSDFDSKAKKWGYKDKTLDAAIKKISQKPREKLLKTQPKKKNNATVFCTKYTKGSEKRKAILKKQWHIQQSDKKIAHPFKGPPMVVYKRGRNIGDSSVRSDLPPEPTQTLLTPIQDHSDTLDIQLQMWLMRIVQ